LRKLQEKPLKNGVFAPAVDVGHVPKEVKGKVEADDRFAAVPDRPPGPLVVCGIGFSAQQMGSAKSQKEFGEALANLDLACAKVAADQNIVIVELPPLRKLK